MQWDSNLGQEGFRIEFEFLLFFFTSEPVALSENKLLEVWLALHQESRVNVGHGTVVAEVTLGASTRVFFIFVGQCGPVKAALLAVNLSEEGVDLGAKLDCHICLTACAVNFNNLFLPNKLFDVGKDFLGFRVFLIPIESDVRASHSLFDFLARVLLRHVVEVDDTVER